MRDVITDHAFFEHCLKDEYDKGYADGKKVIIQREIDDVLNKIREEIADLLYVDSLIFGELIDFKNGKISADDVIEEFNRVTRAEILLIIDKYRKEQTKE